MRQNLGEAYVEEMISVRSDAEYDVFDTTFNNDSSHYNTLSNEEKLLEPDDVL
jgi:hypothetical protein